MARPSAVVALLALCAVAGLAQAALIPIPDAPTPAALTAAPASSIGLGAAPAAAPLAAAPAAAYPAAAGLPAAYPAAAAAPAAAAYPATSLPAAAPAAAFPAAVAAAPAPALPAVGAYPAAGAAAALPVAAAPAPAPAGLPLGFGLSAASLASAAGVSLPGAALPAAALPTGGSVVSVPAAGAVPGALPGIGLPGAAGLGGPLLPPGLLPGDINTMVAAPPPRARPAAPPAPPIPTGATFKPQWNEMDDFKDEHVIVSFNVANTPEQIYWNQKRVREAVAKAGGVLPNSVSYYQVLPSADDFGRPYTIVRFVIANKNPELASNLLGSLNEEKTQNNLKNRIEELNLDMIGDSMKAQTPTDYKASARAASGMGPLPSSATMDTSGGMNAVGGAAGGLGGPAGGLGGPADAAPLPGTSAAAGGGNSSSTAGLPGLPTGGTTSTLAARRAAASGAAGPSAAASALLAPLMLAAGALLL